MAGVPVGARRLASQRLVGGGLRTPLEAARALLALQGQDLPGVKWSLGLRVPGAVEADVEAAFARGEIVRSWPMRGTLHVTAAEDLPWMLELLGPRVVAGAASRRADLGLDARTLERARALAVRRLEGGRALGRAALLAVLEAGGVSTAAQRGYHILFHLSATRTICLGPPESREQAFVLLDEWVRRPRRLDGDEALGELARRYFAGHGPATRRDFAGWAGLTIKDAKIAIAVAGASLTELALGREAYVTAADAEDPPAEAAAASVLALPGFDEYLLGYKERGAVLPSRYAERIIPGANGMFRSTIVVGGQVRGTWRRTARAHETLVEPEFFGRAAREERAGFAGAVEEWGRFVGAKVRVG